MNLKWITLYLGQSITVTRLIISFWQTLSVITVKVIIYDYCSDKGFVSNQDVSERVSQWAYHMAIENNDLVWTPPKKLEGISKLTTRKTLTL